MRLGEVHCADESLCFGRARRRSELERSRVAANPHQRHGNIHRQLVTPDDACRGITIVYITFWRGDIERSQDLDDSQKHASIGEVQT